MCQGTYSPKVREDLIPRLYQLSLKKGQPMTKTVSQAVEEFLSREEVDYESSGSLAEHFDTV